MIYCSLCYFVFCIILCKIYHVIAQKLVEAGAGLVGLFVEMLKAVLLPGLSFGLISMLSVV